MAPRSDSTRPLYALPQASPKAPASSDARIRAARPEPILCPRELTSDVRLSEKVKIEVVYSWHRFPRAIRLVRVSPRTLPPEHVRGAAL